MSEGLIDRRTRQSLENDASKINSFKQANIEEDAIFSKHRRDEDFKKTSHKLLIASLYFLFFLFVIIIGVRVAHMVLPNDCQWLDVHEIQTMDKVLFSGSIGVVFGKFADKIFK